MLFIFLFIAVKSFSQNESEINRHIERAFWKEAININKDCFSYNFLLTLKTNNKGIVTEIKFSDSINDSAKNIFNKSVQLSGFKNAIQLIEERKIVDKILVYPVYVFTHNYPCVDVQSNISYSNDYFKFTGKYLTGDVIFNRAINVLIGKSISRE